MAEITKQDGVGMMMPCAYLKDGADKGMVVQAVVALLRIQSQHTP
jgi:hypothetical protein